MFATILYYNRHYCWKDGYSPAAVASHGRGPKEWWLDRKHGNSGPEHLRGFSLVRRIVTLINTNTVTIMPASGASFKYILTF